MACNFCCDLKNEMVFMSSYFYEQRDRASIKFFPRQRPLLLHYRFTRTKLPATRITFTTPRLIRYVKCLCGYFPFCLNLIFLRSRIITQYIGRHVPSEKRGYETRWFYDAVVTESIFLMGIDSRTRSREEHFISDIVRKCVSNVEDIN